VAIHDTVTNQGANDQEFQLIYHTNYGAPLLEKGAKVVGAFHKLQPMNSHAAKFMATWSDYEAPDRNFAEQVYLAFPISNDKKQSTVLLRNAAGDQGASITWNTSQLPYFTIWKNTAAKADGYVTGLEPATGCPFNRRVERHYGRVPKLKPGQTREFNLSYAIHPDAKTVKEVEVKIQSLQKTRPLELVPTAPDVPELEE